jgi:hypothetical protein
MIPQQNMSAILVTPSDIFLHDAKVQAGIDTINGQGHMVVLDTWPDLRYAVLDGSIADTAKFILFGIDYMQREHICIDWIKQMRESRLAVVRTYPVILWDLLSTNRPRGLDPRTEYASVNIPATITDAMRRLRV